MNLARRKWSSLRSDRPLAGLCSSVRAKASTLLQAGGDGGGSVDARTPYLDGEVVFSWNNVCVHVEQSEPADTQHHLGYLCVISSTQPQHVELVLRWTPNVKLSRQLSAESSSSAGSELSAATAAAATTTTTTTTTPPGVFLCNLMHMRCVLLCRGQASHLIIRSAESQLKIFHFHDGGAGVEKLEQLLAANPEAFRRRRRSRACYAEYYLRPALVRDSESVDLPGPLTASSFEHLVSIEGFVEDPIQFKRTVLLAGVDPSVRRQVWPLLIGFYPYESSTEQRYHIYLEAERRLEELRLRRSQQRQQQQQQEEEEETTDAAEALVLDFAFANQETARDASAMAELMRPLLRVLDDRVEAYHCFDCLLRAGLFLPTTEEVERQLCVLLQLLRLLKPQFYAYCSSDWRQLLAGCRRWISRCFCQEFPADEALAVWEACWARYATDSFHLFVCAAVLDIYGDFCLEKQLPSDEAAAYFGQLAGSMDSEHVLARARQLLLRFRCLSRIPCQLASVCHASGMWDSGPKPIVDCVASQRPHECGCAKK